MLGTGELEEVFFLIINRVNGNSHAFLAFEQGTVLVPLYYSALGRNGMAMRVMSRFSQKLVQPLKYLFRNRMLQLLRLVMNLAPVQTQCFDKKVSSNR